MAAKKRFCLIRKSNNWYIYCPKFSTTLQVINKAIKPVINKNQLIFRMLKGIVHLIIFFKSFSKNNSSCSKCICISLSEQHKRQYFGGKNIIDFLSIQLKFHCINFFFFKLKIFNFWWTTIPLSHKKTSSVPRDQMALPNKNLRLF